MQVLCVLLLQADNNLPYVLYGDYCRMQVLCVLLLQAGGGASVSVTSVRPVLCRDIHCESSYTVYGYPQWITAPDN